MKGFALILGFLALEAAFLWQAAAPRARAPISAPAPAITRESLEARRAPSAPPMEGPRYEIRTFVGKPFADLVPGVSL